MNGRRIVLEDSDDVRWQFAIIATTDYKTEAFFALF